MTLPTVIRIFFAVELSASTKKKLAHFISTLKKESKTHKIRWSKPENLHITLQFLAEVRSEHLETLIENVRAHVKGVMKETTFTFGPLQLFPNPFRPRVIVLEITPQEDLAALAALIGQGIAKSQYAVESRPFRAHLTLGRIKQMQHIDLTFLGEVKAPILETIPLHEIVLFRSEPQPEGSKYTVLERIALLEKISYSHKPYLGGV